MNESCDNLYIIDSYIVFEKSSEKELKQVSIPFTSKESASSFIETMKIGVYYKYMHPEIKLIVMQIKIIK